MTRLFVCVWPPPRVRSLLSALPQPVGDGVRWVAARDRHVTLCFIGDAVTDDVAERLAASDLPAATMVLGPVVELLSERHIVVPVAGGDDLAHAVHVATAGHGESDRYRFRGHLTLARLGRGVAAPLVGRPVAAEFAVDRVALVASELAPGPEPTAPRYTTVAEFATT